MRTTTLYRPVGPDELRLLEQSGWRRWPPRLPGQPIFYPVTNEEYAVEIASRWNVDESGSGYGTRSKSARSSWSGSKCNALAQLEELNDNIVGTIEVIREFFR